MRLRVYHDAPKGRIPDPIKREKGIWKRDEPERIFAYWVAANSQGRIRVNEGIEGDVSFFCLVSVRRNFMDEITFLKNIDDAVRRYLKKKKSWDNRLPELIALKDALKELDGFLLTSRRSRAATAHEICEDCKEEFGHRDNCKGCPYIPPPA